MFADSKNNRSKLFILLYFSITLSFLFALSLFFIDNSLNYIYSFFVICFSLFSILFTVNVSISILKNSFGNDTHDYSTDIPNHLIYASKEEVVKWREDNNIPEPKI